MSLSKVKAKKKRRQRRTEPAVRRRWMLVGSLAIAVVVAIVVRAYLLSVADNVEIHLNDARAALGKAVKESQPARRLSLSGIAKQSIRTYLDGGGTDKQTAELLWCAGLFVEGSTSGQTSVAEYEKIKALFQDITLSERATDDLLTVTLICAQTGELDFGQQLADELIGRDEPRDEILKAVAMMRFQLGEYDAAMDSCRELVHLVPGDPLAWEMLVAIYEGRGHRLQLIDIYERLIEIMPAARDEYQRRLVLRLIEIGDVPRARAEYEELKSTASGFVQKHPLLEAQLLLLEGHTDETLKRLDKILRANPQDFEALVLMGRVLTTQDRPSEAVRLLKRAVEIDPVDEEAHYLLAQAYTNSGDRERGKQHAAISQRLQSKRERNRRAEG